MLDTQPDTRTRSRQLATTYHQLGIVAQRRGELDVAEQWYQRALTITEELGDRPAMASTYHQLGMVAGKRGDLDVAGRWHHRALTIGKELGDRPGMAISYHQLGTVAVEREDFDAAEQWYRQALTINEQLGNQPDMVSNHGQLALLAEARRAADHRTGTASGGHRAHPHPPERRTRHVNEPIAAAARAAAQRLAERYGPRLPGDVEAALHPTDGRPGQYLDPVAIGGLVVSVATLAWTIYQDLTKTTPEPAPQVITRTIRLQLPATTDITTEDRDRIIEAVVTETLRSDVPRDAGRGGDAQ